MQIKIYSKYLGFQQRNVVSCFKPYFFNYYGINDKEFDLIKKVKSIAKKGPEMKVYFPHHKDRKERASWFIRESERSKRYKIEIAVHKDSNAPSKIERFLIKENFKEVINNPYN